MSKLNNLKKQYDSQESINDFLRHSDAPKSIARYASVVMSKFTSLFTFLDKYENTIFDAEFYDSIDLEKLFT